MVSDGGLVVLMDDPDSFIKLPEEVVGEVIQNNFEVKGVRYLSEEGGKVFKSIKIVVTSKVTKGVIPRYIFSKPMAVSIGYDVDSKGRVTNGAPSYFGSQVMPNASDAKKSFSIYWNNGRKWLKLGSTVDTTNTNVTTYARHSGSYQLRLVQQGLDVQANSVYPRTITPNGDRINDKVFFFYENPTDAEVSGTIYDMRSSKVADVQLSDIFAGTNSVLTWDGKDDSGSVVTGGIYLYKIKVGDETFTGTVVVAR